MMIDAVALMAERKISELPVVDAAGRPVGLIDITDVVGLLPPEDAAAAAGRRGPRPPAAAPPPAASFPHPRRTPHS